MFFIITILQVTPEPCQAQYYPRGVRFNDNFLPNLTEPDKFFLLIDGMVDFQKEKQDSGTTVFENTHFQGQMLYGGQQLRGGLLIMQDNSQRNVKDLTVGLSLSIRRPVFFELGVGLLTRSLASETSDGFAATARIGYGIRILHQINYRIRLRITGNFIYKSINTGTGTITGTQFYPLIGLEFET